MDEIEQRARNAYYAAGEAALAAHLLENPDADLGMVGVLPWALVGDELQRAWIRQVSLN